MISYATVTLDSKNKPSFFHFSNQQKTVSFEIFRPNSGKSLSETFKRLNGATELLDWAAQGDLRSPNIGNLFSAFNINEFSISTGARDYAFGSITTTGDSNKDKILCQKLIDSIKLIPDKPYQTVLAKAQSVYAGMNKTGLMLNYTKVQPEWSWNTFSGRSKTVNFNVQGWSDPDVIYQPTIPYNCVHIHFDWICADFRVAAIMSGDKVLNQAFLDSDPYTYLSKELSGCGDELREEAKLLFLKVVNSLDHNDETINKVYPELCVWLRKTLNDLRKAGFSTNILGRPFRIKQDRSERSIFNAILQGSVANAMQCVLWKVRNQFPTYLVTDIHDGLVLSVPKDSMIVKHVVDVVGKMFFRPFEDVLNGDITFPYKVSVGNRWKEWKTMITVRSDQK